MQEPNSPPTAVCLSPGLEAAIEGELKRQPIDGGEATLAAAERVYVSQGEPPFDPLNSADMLLRSFILAEAEESAGETKRHE